MTTPRSVAAVSVSAGAFPALVLSAVLLPAPSFALAQDAAVRQTDVFVSGADGYHTFRIPAVLVSAKGTVLAFCEGRKSSRSDTGDIDMVLRRSTDGGKTWGPLQVVWDDADNTVGNPCPVVDRNTGVIWLPLTRNLGRDKQSDIVTGKSKGTREVWLTKSADDGATWSKPVQITAQVKDPTWTWFATGPGVGIQLKSGRLVIPCDHSPAGKRVEFSFVIYSDDGGATWKTGARSAEGCGEAQVVELADGSLMMNMRNETRVNQRRVVISKDGGLTWGETSNDVNLIEPTCQASLIRGPAGKAGDLGPLLFSNPAGKTRARLTVRGSRDEGKTWSAGLVLHAGPAAYSCLTALPDGSAGCLYERGEKSAYERITFAVFATERVL